MIDRTNLRGCCRVTGELCSTTSTALHYCVRMCQFTHHGNCWVTDRAGEPELQQQCQLVSLTHSHMHILYTHFTKTVQQVIPMKKAQQDSNNLCKRFSSKLCHKYRTNAVLTKVSNFFTFDPTCFSFHISDRFSFKPVKIQKSSTSFAIHGVPQSSELGPLLLYIIHS